VWETQEQDGFVFLSFKDDTGWHDLCYKFGRDEIVIPDAKLGDVYFCPNIFSRPRRSKDLMLPSKWLYADLDKVDPAEVGPKYGSILRPSIAWESSPGRYQALWELDRFLDPELHSTVNQKLTYLIGADKGGWDRTQVLRVPGTINHKYAEEPEVKLLWRS